MVQQGDRVRVGDRIVRRPTTPAQKERFEQTVKREEQRKKTQQRQKKIKQKAQELDEKFKDISKFGTLDNYEEQIKKVPKEIREQMQYNLENVKKKQKENIEEIETRINRNKSRLKSSKDRLDRELNRSDRDESRVRRTEDRISEIQAEIRGLEEGKKKLQQGKLLKPDQVIDFGRQKRQKESARLSQSKLKRQREEQEKELAKKLSQGKGEVTRIKYRDGKKDKAVLADGNEVSLRGLSDKDREKVKLTTVRKGEIERLAGEGKSVGELKDMGLQMSQIAEIGKIELRDKILKGAEGRKLEDRELELLGFNEKQIKAIKDSDITVGDLKKQGLTMRDIAQVGRQRIRNKILERQKIKKINKQFGEFLTKKAKKDNTLNEVTKGMYKISPEYKDRKLNEIDYVAPLDRGLVKAKGFTSEKVEWLDEQRQKAIRGNNNARAALYGTAVFAGAVVDIGLDFTTSIVKGLQVVSGTREFEHNLSDLLSTSTSYVKDFSKDDWKNIKQGFSQTQDTLARRVSQGDPRLLAEAVTLLAPVRVPKSIGKFTASLSSQAGDIAVATTNFKLRQNLLKGSGRYDIEVRGLTKGNKPIEIKGALTARPKDKTLRGKLNIVEGGKKRTFNVNLRDEPGRFVDRRTGITIPKLERKLEGVQANVVLRKENINSKKGITNRLSEGVVTQGDRAEQKIRAIATPKHVSEVTTKKEMNFELFLGSKEGKKYRDFRETNVARQLPKTINQKQSKDRTLGDWDRLVKFLEFIQYDKKIIEGFDRRTWMARLLGMNRNEVNKAIKRFDKDFRDGWILQRATQRATGSYETINPVRFYIGPSFVFSNKGKKARELLNIERGRVKTPQTIKLPDINSLIRIPSRLPKGTQIPAQFLRTAIMLGIAEKYKFRNVTSAQKTKFIQSLTNLQLRQRETQQLRTPRRARKTKQLQKVKQRLTSKLKSPKPKLKKIPKQVQRPIIPKIPRRPPRPRRLRFPTTNLQRQDRKVDGYIIKVRDGDKGTNLIMETENVLPLRRSANIARRFIKKNKDVLKGKVNYKLVRKAKTNVKDLDKVELEDKFTGTFIEAKLKK